MGSRLSATRGLGSIYSKLFGLLLPFFPALPHIAIKELAGTAESSRLSCIHRETNQAQLNELPRSLREALKPTNSSIRDIQAALPGRIGSGRKRDRLKWAASGRGKVDAEISRLKEVESSTILTLSAAAFKEIEGVNPQLEAIQADISEHHDNISSRLDVIEENHEEIVIALHLLQKLTCLHSFKAFSEGLSWRTAAQIYRWNWLLGMNIRLIVLTNVRDKGRNTYDLFLKWPVRLSQRWGRVFTGRMSIFGLWPSRPVLSLNLQNIIPRESAIIEACQKNDVSTIQKLFTRGQAQPNDTTPEYLTLLRFAIRAGNPAVVKVLLENGADPNLTFGLRETSPLNNAFLCGEAEIIRILLAAGADLDYVNNRTWTSVFYLWDPEFEAHPTVNEILDICFEKEFDDWNYTDTLGWGPIHRAAAFGTDRDIQNLMYKGALEDIYTIGRNWTPIHCAALYGNESTFDVLAELIHPYMLIQMRDSLGWGLLHLAAEGGSEKVMLKLLELGADPATLTIPSAISVPKGLEFKELRAETIAEHCGHRQAYDNAVRAAIAKDY